LVVVGAAVTVVALAAVLASSQADVLEVALEQVRSAGAPSAADAAPFADYVSPVGGAWVAGAVGLLAAFLVAWGMTLAVARRRP
ncbi:MAG TPA: hypothetical protein VGA02_11540, partial [Gemmatimonadales bacterium]